MLYLNQELDISGLNQGALKNIHDWLIGRSTTAPDAWAASTLHKLVEQLKNGPATNMTLGTLALTKSPEDGSLWVAHFPDVVKMPPAILAQPDLWNADIQPLSADRLEALAKLAMKVGCDNVTRLPVQFSPAQPAIHHSGAAVLSFQRRGPALA